MSFESLRKARQERQSFVQPTTTSRDDQGPRSVPAPNPNEASVVDDGDADLGETRPSSGLDDAKLPVSHPPDNLYRELPPILYIRTDPQRGRGIYTKTLENGGPDRIPAGQRLISAQPHVHALSTPCLASYCTACHRKEGLTRASLKRCTKCKVVWYCSSACQTIDWKLHKLECVALQRWIQNAPSSSAQVENEGVSIPGDAIRALARLLWIRQKVGSTSGWWKEIQAMQSHKSSLPTTSHQGYTMMAHTLAKYLSDSPTPSPETLTKLGLNSAGDVLDLLSRFATNSFTLTDPSLTPIGVAISPIVALINHSCQPNAVVVFPRASTTFEPGRNPIEVIAIRDLLPGEEVLTAYIDISLPHRHRVKELKERYMFECTCLVCSRLASSDGTNVDPREAIFCGQQECAGMLELSDDLDSDELSERLCTKCRKSLNKEDLESVLDSIRLGEEALEKATAMELEDPERAIKYTSNLIPILSRHLPPTSHPLLAHLRLHQSLLVTQLSIAISSLPPPSTSSTTQPFRIPQKEVDEVCWTSCRALSGIMGGVFPEGHPVRGIALAELGKLLTVDVDSEGNSAESTAGQIFLKSLLWLSSSPPVPTTANSAFPSGAARLYLAREVLLRARMELKRGFGGDGGEVARQVEDGIRNVEKELIAWKRVVFQGGNLISEDGSEIKV